MQDDWPRQLEKLLKSHGQTQLDAAIDSAGGDIMRQVGRILKPGGRVICYGMTASPQIVFTMREVLKNQHLIGTASHSYRIVSMSVDVQNLTRYSDGIA